jgi:hypothetical protein
MEAAGHVVIQPQFSSAHEFAEGLAAVRRAGGWCYINKEGEVVIRGPFNDVERFSSGLARVHVGGKFVRTNDGPAFWEGGEWLYINGKGERIRRCRGDGERGQAYGQELSGRMPGPAMSR